MNIALLYQVHEMPPQGNIRKPMKKGGYRDSGADIAYELKANGYNVILPVSKPDEQNDLDWVFGDDDNGIRKAIESGADTLWLNTVLYDGHPIEKCMGKVNIIGQFPHDVQKYDDKFYTNQLLFRHGLPAINATAVKSADDYSGEYPCVLKPIRGRGSQGVSVAESPEELQSSIDTLVSELIYGTEFMVEPFLSGDEITLAVFPADKNHDTPYCLPPVSRFGHVGGIAPYSGKVAVTQNSRAVEDIGEYSQIISACEKAYALLGLRAPIRIDCRKNNAGEYIMFDVNMKPNMTLGSRSHRSEQDSLMMIAAERAGLSRAGLLQAFIDTAWK